MDKPISLEQTVVDILCGAMRSSNLSLDSQNTTQHYMDVTEIHYCVMLLERSGYHITIKRDDADRYVAIIINGKYINIEGDYQNE